MALLSRAEGEGQSQEDAPTILVDDLEWNW